jgi:hypothetical protein
MRDIKTFVFNVLAGMVSITLIHAPGFAEETSLIRIGPRLGLSGQIFLGKGLLSNYKFVRYKLWRPSEPAPTYFRVDMPAFVSSTSLMPRFTASPASASTCI